MRLGVSLQPASCSGCKNAIDGDGNCATLEVPANLEQVAFFSYYLSFPFILPSLLCTPDWAAEAENHEEPSS